MSILDAAPRLVPEVKKQLDAVKFFESGSPEDAATEVRRAPALGWLLSVLWFACVCDDDAFPLVWLLSGFVACVFACDDGAFSLVWRLSVSVACVFACDDDDDAFLRPWRFDGSTVQ